MTENNKLIAEFLGLTIITDGISLFDTNYKPLAKYHESWNDLMPVLNKIYSLEVYNKYKSETSSLFSDGGIEINTKYISVTFQAVIEFIKWYKT